MALIAASTPTAPFGSVIVPEIAPVPAVCPTLRATSAQRVAHRVREHSKSCFIVVIVPPIKGRCYIPESPCETLSSIRRSGFQGLLLCMSQFPGLFPKIFLRYALVQSWPQHSTQRL